MSSAATRTQAFLGRAVRGVMWAALFAVLAAGAAGLLDQASPTPGTPARAELTYAGDAAVNARLDLADERLTAISADIERLADEAKLALAEITSSDPARLRQALEAGGEAAATIDRETRAVRDSLAGLPGEGPAATIEFSNATLVRRAAILAALDAASSLADHWRQVAARATEVANLTGLIAEHDATVLRAAAQGRDRRYARAAEILDQALLTVADVQSLRARLIAGSKGTVLDEWIERNGEYDVALRALYQALDNADGDHSGRAVQRALREEQAAFARLPPDRRTIVVIVAEVARGGLTQAVVAIDDAHARIDEALTEPAPAATAPA